MMNEKEEGEVEKEKDKGYRHRNRHSDTRHRHKKWEMFISQPEISVHYLKVLFQNHLVLLKFEKLLNLWCYNIINYKL